MAGAPAAKPGRISGAPKQKTRQAAPSCYRIAVAVPVQLLAMAPYLATIVALVLISARRRGSAAPGSLGQIFHTTS